jgi:hypothetical protein
MWVRFSQPWDYRQPGFTIAYPVGDFNVTRDCADKATAAGVAIRLRKASKDATPIEVDPQEWPSEAAQAP